MLLSVPTWLIHILTVTEWFIAIRLFYQYGRILPHRGLCVFAYSMIPHLSAGCFILVFHASGDQWSGVLQAARIMTFIGSVCLFTAATALVFIRQQRILWWVALVSAMVWIVLQISAVGWDQLGRKLLPSTNVVYLLFLITLWIVYYRDRRLLSRLTISGFWFLLVFVAVTIWATHGAQQAGLASLSHADGWHGLSESLLSVSNALIAVGVWRRWHLMTPSPSGRGLG